MLTHFHAAQFHVRLSLKEDIQMADALNAILGAEFPKLCFLGGLLLLLITIFCSRSVRIGPIKLPKIDLFGRILAGVIGLALISVPVLSWFVGTTIGLVPVFSQSASTDVGDQNSFSLIQTAFAKGDEKLLQTFKIKQSHIKKLNAGDGRLYLYVGDVHLKSPSDLLIYKAKREYVTTFKEGHRIEYKNILKTLKAEDIVLQAKVKEGVEISFDYQGKKFKLKVAKVIWYLLASDFMEIQIVEV